MTRFGLLALASVLAGVSAAPAGTCALQKDCLVFEVKPISSADNDCKLTGKCVIEVCMIVNVYYDTCVKKCEGFSHMCDGADRHGCRHKPKNGLPTFDVDEYDAWCPKVIGRDPGHFVDELGETIGSAKCSDVDEVEFCQTGLPGETLYWILKDGSAESYREDKDHDKMTWGLGGAKCDPVITCQADLYTCGKDQSPDSHEKQRAKERTWSYKIPDSWKAADGTCKQDPCICDYPLVDTTCGSTIGDPHFHTWNGEHFEYHGQCDLVLAKDEKFAEGLGLDVQIRTKLVRFWSYIKSAAIRIGDDILEVQGSSEAIMSKDQVDYWVNFEHKGELKTIGGYPVTMFLSDHYQSKVRFEIDLSSKYPGQMIVISTFKEFVAVDFKNSRKQEFGNVVGLLGEFGTGRTLSRDGHTVIQDFMEFGNEWQVLPSDNMLFHDVEAPQFPAKCIEPEDPRGERRRRLDESNITIEQAEEACATLKDVLAQKDCVYDILATQNLDMVGAY